jgi:hypothetical protein
VVDDLSWILQYFSHLDSQLDRLILSIADVNGIDGIEARLERKERRLDLAELPY